MTKLQQLMAPRDAAKALNVSYSRIVQLTQSGDLQEHRDSSGRRFFLASDVESLARKRQGKPKAAGFPKPKIAGLAHAS